MNDVGLLILAAAGGVVLGAFFFGGLMATVRRLPASPHPARLVLTSAMLRMAVLLGGIWLIGGADWRRYAAALAGVLVARTALIWCGTPGPGGAGAVSGES